MKRLISIETADSSKVLECLLCYRRYSREDILKGNYQLSTMICTYCYRDMQRKSYARSCFGKPTMNFPGGKKEYGYDPQAQECRELCPDRRICSSIIIWEGKSNGTEKDNG